MRSTLLVILVLLGAAPVVKAQECTPEKVAVLDLQLDDNRPIVSVTVNGAVRRFLIDTGGILTGITPATAKELQLDPTPLRDINLYTLAGEKFSQSVAVDTLQLGAYTIRNANLAVLPPSLILPDIDGILSPDFLSWFDVDLDFAAHTLNLMTPQHCENKGAYWTGTYATMGFEDAKRRTRRRNGHVIVPIVLDGQGLMAAIDTGSSITIIDEHTARRKFNIRENSQGVVKLPKEPSKGVIKFVYQFQDLYFSGVSVVHPIIFVRANTVERASGLETLGADPDVRRRGQAAGNITPDLIIGTNLLSKLHLYIDYKERNIYVSGADARD